MAQNVIVNKQGIPQVKDFIFGGITAVVSSLIPIIQAVVDSGHLQFDWGKIATAAIIGFLGYILKKVADKPYVKTTYESNAQAKSIGDNIKEENAIS